MVSVQLLYQGNIVVALEEEVQGLIWVAVRGVGAGVVSGGFLEGLEGQLLYKRGVWANK